MGHQSPPSLSSSPPSSPLSMTHPSSWNPYNDRHQHMTLPSTYSHSGGVGGVTNPSQSKDDTMDVWNDEKANVWKDDKNDTTITTTTHSNTNEKNMNHPTETSTSILFSSTMDHFQTRKQSTSFHSTDGTTTTSL